MIDPVVTLLDDALDMNVYCYVCRGSGEQKSGSRNSVVWIKPCENCGGTGRVDNMHISKSEVGGMIEQGLCAIRVTAAEWPLLVDKIECVCRCWHRAAFGFVWKMDLSAPDWLKYVILTENGDVKFGGFPDGTDEPAWLTFLCRDEDTFLRKCARIARSRKGDSMGTLVWNRDPSGTEKVVNNGLVKLIKCSLPWYDVCDVEAKKEGEKWTVFGRAMHTPFDRGIQFYPDGIYSLEIMSSDRLESAKEQGSANCDFVMKVENIIIFTFNPSGVEFEVTFLGESKDGWVKIGANQ